MSLVPRSAVNRLNCIFLRLSRATVVTAFALFVSAAFAHGQSAHFGGIQSISATNFTSFGVVADTAGDLFVADYGNSRILETTAAGNQISLPCNYGQPQYMALDKANNLYVTTAAPALVLRYPLANGQYGSPTLLSTNGIQSPWGIAVDSKGRVLVGDHTTGAIFQLKSLGSQYIQNTFVTPGTFRSPASLAVDLNDNLYVADRGNNRIAVVSTAGVVSSPFQSPPSPNGLAIDAFGNIAVTNLNGLFSGKITGKEFVLLASNFSVPNGVAFGPDGSIYVDDTNAQQIVKHTVPTGPFDFGAQMSDTQSRSYTFVFVFDANAILYRWGAPILAIDGSNHSSTWFVADNNGTCGQNGFFLAGQTCTVNLSFQPRNYDSATSWSGVIRLLSFRGDSLSEIPVKASVLAYNYCSVHSCSTGGGGEVF